MSNRRRYLTHGDKQKILYFSVAILTFISIILVLNSFDKWLEYKYKVSQKPVICIHDDTK